MSAQADAGMKASTFGRRAAAIAYAHKLAGDDPSTSVETIRAVVRGIIISRAIGTAPTHKQAVTADLVQQCSPTARTA